MTQCSFSLDPGETAGESLDRPWSCPHDAHPEAERCLFHLSPDRRAELGVEPSDVTEAVFGLFEAVDPERKQLLGADLPAIRLDYRNLVGGSQHVVDLRFCDVDGLHLSHATVGTPLDISGARVGELDLTETEFEQRFYAAHVDFEGEVHAGDAAFDEEVLCAGATFAESVSFVEGSFDDELELDDAVFEADVTFSGAEFHGRSNVRGDNTSFVGVRFEDRANFGEAFFEHASFEGAVFEAEANFEAATAEGAIIFDDVVFEAAAFEGARFLDNATFKRTEYDATADFRGAVFRGGAHIRHDDADFEESVFHGDARFEGTEFTFADFEAVRFEAEADFEEAIFSSDTTFDDAVFEGLGGFDECRFGEDATFKRTEYHAVADFRGAEFEGGANVLEDDVDFEHAVFHGPARFVSAEFTFVDFHEVTFEDEADFESAIFTEDTTFDDAVFEAFVDFDECRFAEDASFKRTEYHDEVDFRGVEFQGGANVLEDDADFEESLFRGRVQFTDGQFTFTDFHEVTFEDEVTFEEATFDGDADFRGATFEAFADFDEVRFRADGDFTEVVFEDDVDFRGVEFLGSVRHLEDNARFRGATFEGHVEFDDAVFTSANFRDVTFHDAVDFTYTEFRDSLEMAASSNGETAYVNMTGADIEEGSIVQPDDHWVRYDLTRARVGDVSLTGDGGTHELFDYFRFLETDFDGFDFSEHRGYLDRNNWNLHVFDEGGADYQFAVEKTPATVETTYLYAYNNAKAMGDNDAAIEFSIHRAQYRRKKNAAYVTDSSQSLGYRIGKFGDVVGNFLWYQSCGYGYRLWRILAASALVVIGWGIMYALPFTELTNEASLDSYGAVFSAAGVDAIAQYTYYSLITFTTVGYGDINPLNPAARTLAMSEGTLGVLLAALVVFVLGRRVAV